MGRIAARLEGAGYLSERLLRAARQLDREVAEEVQDLGDRAELIYAAHALRDTGRMARGIRAVGQGDEVVVRADARDPRSGFDYVGVTRFGHRVRVIRPNPPRRALAFTPKGGGGTVFRRSVRGFRPAGDWADRAYPQVRAEGERAAARLGRRISLLAL